MFETTEDEDKHLKSMVSDCDIYLTFTSTCPESSRPDDQCFKNVTSSFDTTICGGNINKCEEVISTGGNVVGVNLSKDEKYLFINIRIRPHVPDDEDIYDVFDGPYCPRPMEVKVIDLDSFTILKKVCLLLVFHI